MKLHYIIALLIVLSSCARKSLKYDSKLMWEQNFMQQDNLDEWRINNNTFYGNNETLFLSENVFLTDSGLIVMCKDSVGIATTWQKTDTFLHTGGNMTTWGDNFSGQEFTGRLIEIEMKVPDSWSAFWLLKIPRVIESTGRVHSVPEIDIGENNGNKVDFCVHWGYSKMAYSAYSFVHKAHRPDGEFHRYAVRLLKDGYEFYLDGKLSKKYEQRKMHGGQLVDFYAPYYMIITNAGDKNRFRFDETQLIIKWIKMYK